MDQVSAEDVRGAIFRKARFRAGYRMEDVDAFLDRLEATLVELQRDLADARDSNSVLRAQCDQLRERLEGLDRHETAPVLGVDEATVLTEEIRLRMRRVLREQLALLDD
jgi:DivIVA domain-containing protein